MRGVGHGRHADDRDDPGGRHDDQREHGAPDQQTPGRAPQPGRGGYLSGAYPASPPPAEAPVTGPDPESADPDYRRPDYPTDPGGIALPDLDQGQSPD